MDGSGPEDWTITYQSHSFLCKILGQMSSREILTGPLRGGDHTHFGDAEIKTKRSATICLIPHG